jgi:hypothetical protein
LNHHFAAGFRAAPAFLRAIGHDFVAGELFAGGGAIVARLRTAGAHMADERTLAGGQRRGQLTARGAIGAQLGRSNVPFFAAGDQAQTISMAGIAAQLTIGAGSGAGHEGFLRFRIGGCSE